MPWIRHQTAGLCRSIYALLILTPDTRYLIRGGVAMEDKAKSIPILATGILALIEHA
jgi:hypothetical protein